MLPVGWRNFFSSCAVFSSGRKQVLVLHTTYVLRVSYHTVVVLCQFFGIFLLWRESGSGGKLEVILLWRESFITTGKKRYSCLSGRCVIIITTGKKRYSCLSGGCAIMSVFFVVIIIFVLVQLELYLIQIRQFNFNISVTYKLDTYNTRDTNYTTLICM